ncbi:DNA mismatch repair protein MutS [Solemya pervernicosa gill symbiont]|uniref:DNA mismatch repair protein MutS n=2 Tax=Gammaproteobacteria incertae sedis TaxID=118884 RepID=A0A1T2L7W2_9GAMM|nr:Smr/MutS family protein [Candidatus Reidiella endopervernicosa]OOZ41205.1 DNA mismatch repair protein MutS [Solemya pervernicosa gill symbiont]QKQ27068.1 Smr/MutS family protein [Candidatus Reidiella endopervernicosa]
MRKKNNITEEDRALFSTETRGIEPLRHDKVVHEKRRTRPYPHMSRQGEFEAIQDMFSDGYEPADMERGEELYFRRPGVQHNLLRKLRRGQYRLDAELDLHGMTAAEAKQALSYFLSDALYSGLRNIRIIHGKGIGSRNGQPVLKRKINLWLQQRSEVLAFCSARPADGGTGALYLLLKGG